MTETFFHRWFEEVWNKGRLEAIDELLAPNCTVYRLHEDGSDSYGREGFKTFFQKFRAAFPDIHITVEDALEVGEKSVARFTFAAVHRGDTLGFAPTERRVRITGMCWGTIRDGKCVEAWNNWDQLALMNQLGLIQKK
jgi:steroid delta-isomerase-like uncharacterized protein